MADAVSTNVIHNSSKKYIAQFTNLSDGTGESAVQKIDISGLTNQLGAAPTKVKINKINYSISGMSVGILFDHTTDDQVLVLSGSGEKDFTKEGGLADPASSGGTGDILFTTYGHAANDSYDITMEIQLSNK
jgi:hypothetical protein